MNAGTARKANPAARQMSDGTMAKGRTIFFWHTRRDCPRIPA